MPLSTGDKLGPYEILSLIGAGGMGEVYRARDTRLKRDVALKVLPDAFARDPERMARFQREAEVLASLNHPNIAHVYGVEDRALVMELVEGPTLPCPLPLDTALNYAHQIADALEYAHEHAVVHRDLKPANIKVTPEGTVKLLDFGLAKAIEDPAASADPSLSPTLTLGATRVGMIMGTAAYMSPEQASGKTVDRRADIWSFGAVLYEMLSGKRAFEGESTSDTLASVLKLDPDWRALPKETPASVGKLVRRCLTKDRRQRLQAIGEARIALERPGEEFAPAPVTAPLLSRLSIATMAAGLFALIAAVLAFVHFREKPPDQPLVRLDVDLGPDVALPLALTSVMSTIISPDGTRIVYASGDPPKLFTKKLAQATAAELPGTEGADSLFFSPDGQWIGFYARNKLNKISVEGGPVVPLAELNFSGASWGEDATIVAGGPKGLVRIPSGGGPATPVTALAAGEVYHALPQFLPGGNAVLFTAYETGLDAGKTTIEVVTLADRRRKTLARGVTSPRYLGTSNRAGYLLYSNKGTLFAIPFDLDRLETRGTAVPVLDGVTNNLFYSSANLDISRGGTVIYRKGDIAGGPAVMTTIQWLDGAGRKKPLLNKPGIYRALSFSPDGNRLAMEVIEGPNQDIWVYDWQRDTMTRLSSGGGLNVQPTWTPDGRYVVFTNTADGMHWTRSDGAGQPQVFMQSKILGVASSFSPDGKRLAYYSPSDTSGAKGLLAGVSGLQIWTVPMEDSGGQLRAGKPEPFLQDQFNDFEVSFSPDGRWLAYLSNESGKDEVYVRPFPPPASGEGGRWQVSNGGARWPRWSRAGHELLYQSGDQIMAVSYTVKGDVFAPGKPRVWAAKLGGAAWFDPAPDGKRIAISMPVNAPEAQKAEHEVTILFNFSDELRRRVPVGK
jgi:WD40 repeat protein